MEKAEATLRASTSPALIFEQGASGRRAAAQAPADVVFYATPDRVGMKLAREELAKGAKVVDYSGDFRFTTAEAYADYAARIGTGLRMGLGLAPVSGRSLGVPLVNAPR